MLYSALPQAGGILQVAVFSESGEKAKPDVKIV